LFRTGRGFTKSDGSGKGLPGSQSRANLSSVFSGGNVVHQVQLTGNAT
jgi:hypothetical protein